MLQSIECPAMACPVDILEGFSTPIEYDSRNEENSKHQERLNEHLHHPEERPHMLQLATLGICRAEPNNTDANSIKNKPQ